MMRILLLGGTAGASQLAALLHAAGLDAVFSYAGVTLTPKRQPLPTRTGGFGGAQGLAQYIRAERISHVVDATHPFAAQMSRNAIAACAATHVPLLALQRPAWQPQAGDQWLEVADMQAAVQALPAAPQRVFLGIGRKAVADFAGAPQHDYLVRTLDAIPNTLPLPDCECLVARGPFSVADERALFEKHRISMLVSKNAGGTESLAKLQAARDLGLPVIMVQRPALPPRTECAEPQEVLAWLSTHAPQR